MDPDRTAWIARPTASMSPNPDPTAWIAYRLVCAMHVDSLFSQLHVGSSADSGAVMDPDQPWKRRVDPMCEPSMHDSVKRLHKKRAESITPNQKQQREVAESEGMLCSGAGDPIVLICSSTCQ